MESVIQALLSLPQVLFLRGTPDIIPIRLLILIPLIALSPTGTRHLTNTPIRTLSPVGTRHLTPFLNNFRGLFGWQSPTLPINSYPGYTNPGNIFPGDIRALYGISVNPISPPPYTSYTPPDSGGWLLYGINLPTSYAPPTSTNLYMYGVDTPPANSQAVFKI